MPHPFWQNLTVKNKWFAITRRIMQEESGHAKRDGDSCAMQAANLIRCPCLSFPLPRFSPHNRASDLIIYLK